MVRLKLSMALLLAAGLFLVQHNAAAPQQPDGKQDKQPKKDEPKKEQPKIDKKEEPKKEEPKAGASGIDALKERLKAQDQELQKIRQAMLKEVFDEERKVVVALQQEMEGLNKDRRAGKFANREQLRKVNNLQAQKSQLTSLRLAIENGLSISGKKTAMVPPASMPPIMSAYGMLASLNDEHRLGIHVYPPNSTLLEQLELPKNQGMVVDRVDSDSPASKCGLKAHDVLVKVDGKAVSSERSEFLRQLADIKSDTPFEAVIVRGGKKQTINGLTIPAAPRQPAPPPRIKKVGNNG